ncbi:hypothetical protein VCSRO86_3365 [Vibrio cholerae]|nr:hypothetical protein VCSRO86_3365 [Vibrio cholerae]
MSNQHSFMDFNVTPDYCQQGKVESGKAHEGR